MHGVPRTKVRDDGVLKVGVERGERFIEK